MRIPVVYELNGRRRCLLVQDGQTISVGRAEACSIRLEGDAVQEVEFSAQFVNGCQFVVVHPTNGSVPYAQALPWKLPLAGLQLELRGPAKPAQGGVERELVVQGLGAEEIRLLLKPDQPLLLGASPECDVVIPDGDCPAALLAMWAGTGSQLLVQVLDSSAVVGWLGRAGENEVELPTPVSLSIGGRMILITHADAAFNQGAAAKPAAAAAVVVPKATAILAKNTEVSPKIVARQAKPAGKEDASGLAPKGDPAGRPVLQAPSVASRPALQPRSATLISNEEFELLTEQALNPPKPASPVVFILASWLLVGLTFAVALLPQYGILSPEQMVQLWAVAGGMLILTLVLGLVVLLK